MSLENLLAIRRLQKHEASRESILKLLSAAERNLADSRAANISAENRFDASLAECIGQAERLFAKVQKAISATKSK